MHRHWTVLPASTGPATVKLQSLAASCPATILTRSALRAHGQRGVVDQDAATSASGQSVGANQLAAAGIARTHVDCRLFGARPRRSIVFDQTAARMLSAPRGL